MLLVLAVRHLPLQRLPERRLRRLLQLMTIPEHWLRLLFSISNHQSAFLLWMA
jgi:hypothetical protein